MPGVFPVSTSAGGMAMAMPDVCQTPAPPAGPVPIPYPNMAQLATADASTCSMKVLVESQPVHHVATEIPMSNGDEPGVNGGVVSGSQLGVCKRVQASTKVTVEGNGVVFVGGVTAHNGDTANAPVGNQVAPSQAKVLVSP